jgi:DNA-binding response OmpR family regulator
MIILDVMMPKMDGYKMCAMLKFDKRYKDIPIIMLTAKAQEIDKLTGEQCGADAYLLKSQSPDVLIKKIKELMK